MNEGLCQCGCGQMTKIAPQDHNVLGWIKGQPINFIKGHSGGRPRKSYTVDTKTGCWNSTGHIAKTGYPGHSMIKGKREPFYRVMYIKHKGNIPLGMQLDHLCRNRKCVNPEHLDPVTPAENVRRGKSTKLNIEKVKAIRSLTATGLSQHAIAKQFNVSRGAIEAIISGSNWREVRNFRVRV